MNEQKLYRLAIGICVLFIAAVLVCWLGGFTPEWFKAR